MITQKHITLMVTLTIISLLASSAIAAEKVVVIPLLSCSGGLKKCSGQCVDINNNPDFCGDCMTACEPGRYCANGKCIKHLGDVCIAGSECPSGNCVDGVCCDSACTSLCESCAAGNTGGTDGTCAQITIGTDPDNECLEDLICGLKGNCSNIPGGYACLTDSDCISEMCIDSKCASKVFASSTPLTGNLGGLAGADAICNELAAEAGLSGTFKAWLSDAQHSPSTTHRKDNGPYVLVSGDIVADNWDELTGWNELAGQVLRRSISLDEAGGPAGHYVWTNTNYRGDPITREAEECCFGWTSDNPLGQPYATGWVGEALGMNVDWTMLRDPDSGLNGCRSLYRIYCFEQ